MSRAIERGTTGIEFLLNFTLFSVLPTLLEVALVCGILWKLHGPTFALITFAAIAGYITWTLTVTKWRTKFRRLMNESDSDAMHKAVDSLLNFEIVKYFSSEEHEARRFGRALRAYEGAAVKSKTSLSIRPSIPFCKMRIRAAEYESRRLSHTLRRLEPRDRDQDLRTRHCGRKDRHVFVALA